MGGQHGSRQRPFLRTRLRDSEKHRREVTTAREWGVSRRRFLGWEPRKVTTYEYDDAGRLSRAVTVTEAEWNEDDRGWAYALTEHEGDKCPGGCGQPLSETTAVGADDDYRVRFIQCHACAARARASEDRHTQGELVVVTRDPAARVEEDVDD